MSNRRVRSISPNDPRALEKIIEALEVSEGVRGADADRKPTVSEVRLMIGSGGASIGAGVPPTIPTGLRVAESKDSVAVSWDIPTYIGHGSSDIYRSPSNRIADAVQVGTTAANFFVDFFTVAEQEYFYFVRHRKSLSMGRGAGYYSEPINGKRKLTPALPTAISGVLDKNNRSEVINIGSIGFGRKVRIELRGQFTSKIDYSFYYDELHPAVGNPNFVDITRASDDQAGYYNDNWHQLAYPVRTPASLPGPYGQMLYSHILHHDYVEIPAPGETKYTLSATAILPNDKFGFPVDEDFTINYIIHLI